MKVDHFQYEVGKCYHSEKPAKLGSSGFHCYGRLEDAFFFYPYFYWFGNKSMYCRVFIGGQLDQKHDEFAAVDMFVSNRLNGGYPLPNGDTVYFVNGIFSHAVPFWTEIGPIELKRRQTRPVHKLFFCIFVVFVAILSLLFRILV
jgi:hypothetical protein